MAPIEPSSDNEMCVPLADHRERVGTLEVEGERLRRECDLMHAHLSEAIAERNAARNEVMRLRSELDRAADERG